MGSRSRRVYGDALVSGGVLLVVLGLLVSVDERVREQVSAAAAGGWSSTLADFGTRLQEAGSSVADAARTQSIDHAPLLIFVLVATVLLLAMVRT